MNIEVSLLHKAYTPDLRDFVEEKVSNLSKFNERLSSVRAVLDLEHDDHKAELVAKVDGGPQLVAEAKADNARGAIDIAVDRMARSLRKHREKITEGRRH